MNGQSDVNFKTSPIQYFKEMLFTDWRFTRWLRLGLGLFVLWHAIQRPDVFTGIISMLLLFQAFTNTGCCGASGCAVTSKQKHDSKTKDVDYEEVKGISKNSF